MAASENGVAMVEREPVQNASGLPLSKLQNNNQVSNRNKKDNQFPDTHAMV